jgi:hypothetical protein
MVFREVCHALYFCKLIATLRRNLTPASWYQRQHILKNRCYRFTKLYDITAKMAAVLVRNAERASYNIQSHIPATIITYRLLPKIYLNSVSHFHLRLATHTATSVVRRPYDSCRIK